MDCSGVQLLLVDAQNAIASKNGSSDYVGRLVAQRPCLELLVIAWPRGTPVDGDRLVHALEPRRWSRVTTPLSILIDRGALEPATYVHVSTASDGVTIEVTVPRLIDNLSELDTLLRRLPSRDPTTPAPPSWPEWAVPGLSALTSGEKLTAYWYALEFYKQRLDLAENRRPLVTEWLTGDNEAAQALWFQALFSTFHVQRLFFGKPSLMWAGTSLFTYTLGASDDVSVSASWSSFKAQPNSFAQSWGLVADQPQYRRSDLTLELERLDALEPAVARAYTNIYKRAFRWHSQGLELQVVETTTGDLSAQLASAVAALRAPHITPVVNVAERVHLSVLKRDFERLFDQQQLASTNSAAIESSLQRGYTLLSMVASRRPYWATTTTTADTTVLSDVARLNRFKSALVQFIVARPALIGQVWPVDGMPLAAQFELASQFFRELDLEQHWACMQVFYENEPAFAQIANLARGLEFDFRALVERELCPSESWWRLRVRSRTETLDDSVYAGMLVSALEEAYTSVCSQHAAVSQRLHAFRVAKAEHFCESLSRITVLPQESQPSDPLAAVEHGLEVSTRYDVPLTLRTSLEPADRYSLWHSFATRNGTFSMQSFVTQLKEAATVSSSSQGTEILDLSSLDEVTLRRSLASSTRLAQYGVMSTAYVNELARATDRWPYFVFKVWQRTTPVALYQTRDALHLSFVSMLGYVFPDSYDDEGDDDDEWAEAATRTLAVLRTNLMAYAIGRASLIGGAPSLEQLNARARTWTIDTLARVYQAGYAARTSLDTVMPLQLVENSTVVMPIEWTAVNSPDLDHRSWALAYLLLQNAQGDVAVLTTNVASFDEEIAFNDTVALSELKTQPQRVVPSPGRRAEALEVLGNIEFYEDDLASNTSSYTGRWTRSRHASALAERLLWLDVCRHTVRAHGLRVLFNQEFKAFLDVLGDTIDAPAVWVSASEFVPHARLLEFDGETLAHKKSAYVQWVARELVPVELLPSNDIQAQPVAMDPTTYWRECMLAFDFSQLKDVDAFARSFLRRFDGWFASLRMLTLLGELSQRARIDAARAKLRMMCTLLGCRLDIVEGAFVLSQIEPPPQDAFFEHAYLSSEAADTLASGVARLRDAAWLLLGATESGEQVLSIRSAFSAHIAELRCLDPRVPASVGAQPTQTRLLQSIVQRPVFWRFEGRINSLLVQTLFDIQPSGNVQLANTTLTEIYASPLLMAQVLVYARLFAYDETAQRWRYVGDERVRTHLASTLDALRLWFMRFHYMV